jgi:hypothetical protein
MHLNLLAQEESGKRNDIKPETPSELLDYIMASREGEPPFAEEPPFYFDASVKTPPILFLSGSAKTPNEHEAQRFKWDKTHNIFRPSSDKQKPCSAFNPPGIERNLTSSTMGADESDTLVSSCDYNDLDLQIGKEVSLSRSFRDLSN